jgi:DNA gyrase subunit A
MVRPAASRYPLVEGEGNWGDGTVLPTEPQFTTCRLSDAGRSVLSGLLPNLLLNGALGDGTPVYVGLPHNSGEVLGAALRIAENDAIDDQTLLHEVPGPDLPEGGVVLLNEGTRKAEATGEGTVPTSSPNSDSSLPTPSAAPTASSASWLSASRRRPPGPPDGISSQRPAPGAGLDS